MDEDQATRGERDESMAGGLVGGGRWVIREQHDGRRSTITTLDFLKMDA